MRSAIDWLDLGNSHVTLNSYVLNGIGALPVYSLSLFTCLIVIFIFFKMSMPCMHESCSIKKMKKVKKVKITIISNRYTCLGVPGRSTNVTSTSLRCRYWIGDIRHHDRQ